MTSYELLAIVGSSIAVAISIASFFVALNATRIADRTRRDRILPRVIVEMYGGKDRGGFFSHIWLRNIGEGTAYSVEGGIVARDTAGGRVPESGLIAANANAIDRGEPIAVDISLVHPLRDVWGGLEYVDSQGKEYCSSKNEGEGWVFSE